MKKFFAQVCVLLCIIIAPAFALCACESERPQYTFDNTDRCTYTLGVSRKRKTPRADVVRLLFRLIARFFIRRLGEAQLRITRLICGALDEHI